MLTNRGNLLVIIMISITLLCLTVPYAYAWWSTTGDHVFGGFLFNPVDGNSYLAKMYQGWQGEWRFTLPYTAEKGDGTFLFVFYMLLGHVSRILKLDLRFTFHIFRLIATVFMYLALFRFIKYWLRGEGKSKVAFILAAVGAGLGWLVFPIGLFTSDFWVAETYPWLSAFANPHFPFGLGLMLIILIPPEDNLPNHRQKILKDWPIGIAAALLALVSPFGVVVVLVVIGANGLWRLVSGERPFKISPYDWRLLWVILFAGPIMLYEFWVIYTDPLLSVWNEQNQTPSPPVWDLIISLSPLLILAVIFSIKYIRDPGTQPNTPKYQLLLIWVWLGIILLYVPFGLQRRFMLGLYVPVTILGVLGFSLLSGSNTKDHKPRLWLVSILVFILVIPTNIVILLVANHGITTRDPMLFLTRGEADAFSWIAINSDQDALVLASPATGLFIPAYTGRRVIYGHPFETVNAEEEEAFVEKFYLGHMTDTEAISEFNRRGVDYIFYGPREQNIGAPAMLKNLKEAYAEGGVSVYAYDSFGG